MVWAKGQSGNPSGRNTKDKPFRDALRAEIAAAIDDNDPRALRKVARSLLETASAGDVSAIREVADRLDGKVPQTHAGDDDLDPITMRTIVTGVPRPGDPEGEK